MCERLCLCVGGKGLLLHLLENESVCVCVCVGVTRWMIRHSLALMDVSVWVFVWVEEYMCRRWWVCVCVGLYVGGIQWVDVVVVQYAWEVVVYS